MLRYRCIDKWRVILRNQGDMQRHERHKKSCGKDREAYLGMMRCVEVERGRRYDARSGDIV